MVSAETTADDAISSNCAARKCCCIQSAQPWAAVLGAFGGHRNIPATEPSRVVGQAVSRRTTQLTPPSPAPVTSPGGQLELAGLSGERGERGECANPHEALPAQRAVPMHDTAVVD